MSVKNPLAPLTEEHGLKRCSMNRCCNVREIIRLKELLIEACLLLDYEDKDYVLSTVSKYFDKPEIERLMGGI